VLPWEKDPQKYCASAHFKNEQLVI